MKELTLFYFPECPYCQRAMKYQEEIFREHPEYRQIPLRMVDENRWREEADRYDYWYVPAYFLGDEKLCEGAKDKETVLAAFRRAWEAE